MAVIPKRSAFRLHFRNKIKTQKILNRDFRMRRLLKKCSREFPNALNNHKKFVPPYGVKVGISVEKKIDAWDFKQAQNEKESIKFNGFSYCRSNFWSAVNPLFSVNNNPLKLSLKGEKHNNNGKQEARTAQKDCRTFKIALQPKHLYLKKKNVFTLMANKLVFGRYGICFKEYGIVGSKFVETARLDIAKILRKKGRSWVRICCDTPVSARPAETRMGKGKGPISYWAAKVHPGQLFVEFSGVTEAQLREIYQKLCKKSAINLKTIY